MPDAGGFFSRRHKKGIAKAAITERVGCESPIHVVRWACADGSDPVAFRHCAGARRAQLGVCRGSQVAAARRLRKVGYRDRANNARIRGRRANWPRFVLDCKRREPLLRDRRSGADAAVELESKRAIPAASPHVNADAVYPASEKMLVCRHERQCLFNACSRSAEVRMPSIFTCATTSSPRTSTAPSREYCVTRRPRNPSASRTSRA